MKVRNAAFNFDLGWYGWFRWSGTNPHADIRPAEALPIPSTNESVQFEWMTEYLHKVSPIKPGMEQVKSTAELLRKWENQGRTTTAIKDLTTTGLFSSATMKTQRVVDILDTDRLYNIKWRHPLLVLWHSDEDRRFISQTHAHMYAGSQSWLTVVEVRRQECLRHPIAKNIHKQARPDLSWLEHIRPLHLKPFDKTKLHISHALSHEHSPELKIKMLQDWTVGRDRAAHAKKIAISGWQPFDQDTPLHEIEWDHKDTTNLIASIVDRQLGSTNHPDPATIEAFDLMTDRMFDWLFDNLEFTRLKSIDDWALHHPGWDVNKKREYQVNAKTAIRVRNRQRSEALSFLSSRAEKSPSQTRSTTTRTARRSIKNPDQEQSRIHPGNTKAYIPGYRASYSQR
jgi:hypothetical protein